MEKLWDRLEGSLSNPYAFDQLLEEVKDKRDKEIQKEKTEEKKTKKTKERKRASSIETTTEG